MLPKGVTNNYLWHANSAPHAQILLYAPTNKYNLIYQGVLWFENYRPDDYINERQNPLIMKLLSNENNCLLKKEKRNVKRTNGLF